MPSLRLKLTALLAAAAVGPYVATETDVGRKSMSTVRSLFGGASTGDAISGLAPGIAATEEERTSGYANHSHYEIEKLRQVGADRYRYDTELARKLGAIPQDPAEEPTLSGYQVKDLREVLRFDIGPDWVVNRFSRVSTVLADLKLKGLRVPVVTGIMADDVAGTLTFYFDHSDRLQRLTFHGFTGDPARFAEIMTSYFGLAREPALEAGAFTKRWNGRPVHFMRLTHAPVVYSNAVHQKYTVFLELNQPDLAYGISEEARKIVISDRHTGRW
ncbi:DUF6690 family protein [Rhodopirellula sp. JC639]|uniref:DUF6690 family protein n=1 Tax=Stieleria mannarensis TaxID=2755585 RepID=UPI00160383BC|nr:DUF6690 family protein [Rhodopirellula sp. JC639]